MPSKDHAVGSAHTRVSGALIVSTLDTYYRYLPDKYDIIVPVP